MLTILDKFSLVVSDCRLMFSFESRITVLNISSGQLFHSSVIFASLLYYVSFSSFLCYSFAWEILFSIFLDHTSCNLVFISVMILFLFCFFSSYFKTCLLFKILNIWFEVFFYVFICYLFLICDGVLNLSSVLSLWFLVCFHLPKSFTFKNTM